MTVTLSQIRDAVADHTGVCLQDLMGPLRKAAIIRPRQVAYKLARELTNATDGMIAHSLGRSDASTVRSGVEAFDCRQCPEQIAALKEVRRKLIDQDELSMGGVFRSRRSKAVAFKSTRNAAQSLHT